MTKQETKQWVVSDAARRFWKNDGKIRMFTGGRNMLKTAYTAEIIKNMPKSMKGMMVPACGVCWLDNPISKAFMQRERKEKK